MCRSLRLLAFLVLAIVALGAGASSSGAATTTTAAASYDYDHLAPLAQDNTGTLRLAASSAPLSARPHGASEPVPFVRRAGLAAEEGVHLGIGEHTP